MGALVSCFVGRALFRGKARECAQDGKGTLWAKKCREGDKMPEPRRSRTRAGKSKDQGEAQEVTLHRVGVEDGVVIPTLMGWSTLDPNDTARAQYLEEVAEELGVPREKEK